MRIDEKKLLHWIMCGHAKKCTWMGGLRFYVFSKNISVISEQWEIYSESLFAMKAYREFCQGMRRTDQRLYKHMYRIAKTPLVEWIKIEYPQK